jgi:hypothetical protein
MNRWLLLLPLSAGCSLFGVSSDPNHAAVLEVTPASITPTNTTASMEARCRNTGRIGSGPIRVSLASTDFVVVSDDCSGRSLAAGADCAVSVRAQSLTGHGTLAFDAQPGGSARVELTESIRLRLRAPLSTSTVTSRRPTLSWFSPRTGLSNTKVELCSDRQCNIPLAMLAPADPASDTQLKVPSDLHAGVVFWRVSTIDKSSGEVITSPTWEFWVGARTATLLDSSFGTIPDVNGDGHADVLVAAKNAMDSNGNNSAGRVYVFLGGPGGLDTEHPVLLEGKDGAGGSFGNSIASAGDVNGDGFGDAVVGAPYTAHGKQNAGTVYLFLGSDKGLDVQNPIVIIGSETNGGLGADVSSAGDINGDGFGDLVTGAPFTTPGHAYVFYGNAGGVDIANPTRLDGAAGEQMISEFGVSSFGADVDGDGFSDVIVGSPDAQSAQGTSQAGRVYVFRGGPTGLDTANPSILEAPDGVGAFGAFFGVNVALAGDVNGDGYPDIIAGAFAFTNSAGSLGGGRAYVFLGGSGGLDVAHPIRLEGVETRNGHFGVSVAGANDVDGNGFSDVVVGTEAGRAYVFFGGPTGIDAAHPTVLDRGDGEYIAVSGSGDIDGSGHSDVLMGVLGANRAYLFSGSATGLDVANPEILNGPDGASSAFGNSVARKTRPAAQRARAARSYKKHR